MLAWRPFPNPPPLLCFVWGPLVFLPALGDGDGRQFETVFDLSKNYYPRRSRRGFFMCGCRIAPRLGEIHGCLKPGSKRLLAESPIHVTAKTFAKEAAIAKEAGFELIEQPRIRWSHAALFVKVDPEIKNA
jgi:hypothetical protein